MERQTKPCEICGNPIPWVDGDYPKRYGKKRFCGAACSNRSRRVWKSSSEYNKWYAEEHREKRRQQKAAWYQANKEKEAQRRKQWNEDNPDYHAEWKQENSEKCCIYSHNRRSMIRKNGGSFTEKEWFGKLEEHDYRCAICDAHNDDSPMTMDHIIPISRGGRNEISNIQPLCSSCNCKKAAS